MNTGFLSVLVAPEIQFKEIFDFFIFINFYKSLYSCVGESVLASRTSNEKYKFMKLNPKIGLSRPMSNFNINLGVGNMDEKRSYHNFFQAGSRSTILLYLSFS